MSNSKKPGRIIRTSSGSTRLTASSDADKPKPAEAEQNKLAANTPEAGSQSNGDSGSAPTGSAGDAERAADKPKAGSQQAASAPAGVTASGPVHSTSKGVRIGGKKDSSDSGAASGSAPAAASGAGSASGAGASAASAPAGTGTGKPQQDGAKKDDSETTVMQTSGTRTTAQGSQNAAQTESVSPSGGEAAASAASGPASGAGAASGPSAVTASSSQGLRMSGSAQRKGPRTVKLAVSKVDPWSVMKMTFMLSLALGIATIVVMFVLWLVLEVTGTFGSLQAALAEFAGEEGADQLLQVFGLGRILSFAVIIAVVNVILMTALSTLTSIIYNIGSSLVGGFHLTLTDD
ncbi:hypothetical protein HMPREF3172_05925 [Brevibacterium sp. HMSC08F02]|uniref:DUF3566 domain-containing protein n=1 Tax=Brevibacterium sp. HMSC08F02 TaxID=1581140 RepID=UPI0008A5756A|nr:DUF3566 domain-containing protein [Brevibacterium sp. HMSC08F02]OFT25814.1 hypothetical protein HMPREF3172_05925 [Brevibacterium sp. HMSC08F02]